MTPEHGTAARYDRTGCRCEACCRSKALYRTGHMRWSGPPLAPAEPVRCVAVNGPDQNTVGTGWGALARIGDNLYGSDHTDDDGTVLYRWLGTAQ